MVCYEPPQGTPGHDAWSAELDALLALAAQQPHGEGGPAGSGWGQNPGRGDAPRVSGHGEHPPPSGGQGDEDPEDYSDSSSTVTPGDAGAS